MATEKRLIGSLFKCDNCIHTKACERLCAIFNWDFEDCAIRSAYCKAYEPKTDAVEVVHGRWTTGRYGYECSVCKNGYLGLSKTMYCPNCGAKMDGDGNV